MLYQSQDAAASHFVYGALLTADVAMRSPGRPTGADAILLSRERPLPLPRPLTSPRAGSCALIGNPTGADVILLARGFHVAYGALRAPMLCAPMGADAILLARFRTSHFNYGALRAPMRLCAPVGALRAPMLYSL